MKVFSKLCCYNSLFLLSLFAIFFCCKPDEVLLNNENNIVSIQTNDKNIQLNFNPINNSISITLPFDYTSDLIPVKIEVSPGAIHSLVGGSVINVNSVKQITVTAEDGTTQVYNVHVEREKNDQNLILEFLVEIEDTEYFGIIDNENNTIKLEIPSRLDISELSPSIKYSDNGSVNPDPLEKQNFEQSIQYTVTSESGVERIYSILIESTESDANLITSFWFPTGENSHIEGTIVNETNTIEISVPFLFEISDIEPIIEISEYAEISFSEGTSINFENEVFFVVSAENGDQRNYSIKVSREENTANYILNFSFLMDQEMEIEALSIDNLNNVITIEVPFDFDKTNVTPVIEISENASITPSSGQSQNFENQIKYTVVSEDGEPRIYSIIFQIEKSNQNFIAEFNIPFNNNLLEGLINNEDNTITVDIPYELDLTNIAPTIELSDLATINPESGLTQNFENEINYTVTAENGDERIYTLKFNREPNPEALLIEYKVSDEQNTYFATIDQEEKTINLSVPFNFDYENAKVLFNFSDHATVISSGNSLFDYKYLVISESGNRNLYTVNFTREANTENFILSFTVNIDGVVSEGIIDNEKNTIIVNVPFTSDTTITTPIIEVSENASYIPQENTEIDLTNATYTVQSASGDLRFYTLVINKEKSSDNTISSFSLTIDDQIYYGQIDNEKNEIVFQVPKVNDLSNLTPTIEFAKFATLFPTANESQNFENTVVYSVAAENDDLRNYTVVINEINLNSLTDNYSLTCDQYTNFSQWLGGDDRAEFKPRNVGAGQAIRMESDINPSHFSIFIRSFQYSSTREEYPLSVTLKLTVRNEDGSVIGSKNTVVPPSKEGWVDFDLSGLDLFLQKGVVYIFTIHVPDGEKIEVNTGIRGGTDITDSGICYLVAYSAVSRKDNPKDLDNWDSWHEKGFNNVYDTFFNFRLIGKK